MSRQAIIQQIMQQLTQIGVPYTIGQGSDITVQTEFVDAGWSTGKKKIVYEASILADEQSRTLSMWEKTTETGGGFSGGFSGESSFQSGTTLMRKVKSIQYGPDGKVFEYNLNLGAIPKAVKESAKAFNWSFRTVLRRDKAMYPAGSAQQSSAVQQPESVSGTSPQAQPPVSTAAAAVAAAAAPTAAAHRYCTQCGSLLSAGALFCTQCGQKTT